MNLQILIETYQRELDNLKWHLDKNKDHLSESGIRILETRIIDRTNFINDLKRLQDEPKQH